MEGLKRNLEDAGCDSSTSEAIRRLYANHRVDDAVRALRKHWCNLMDALHESQERVDRLDYLIRSMEEEGREERSQARRLP